MVKTSSGISQPVQELSTLPMAIFNSSLKLYRKKSTSRFMTNHSVTILHVPSTLILEHMGDQYFILGINTCRIVYKGTLQIQYKNRKHFSSHAQFLKLVNSIVLFHCQGTSFLLKCMSFRYPPTKDISIRDVLTSVDPRAGKGHTYSFTQRTSRTATEKFKKPDELNRQFSDCTFVVRHTIHIC